MASRDRRGADRFGGLQAAATPYRQRRSAANDFINVKNTSFEIVAEVAGTGTDTNGVIVQQGGRFGGWSLYVKKGKPVFAYNYLGLKTYTATGESTLQEGKSTVTMEFAYDGGQPGAGGTATISIDGKKVGSARVDKTESNVFSADETANVGRDKETPVWEDYTAKTSGLSLQILTPLPVTIFRIKGFVCVAEKPHRRLVLQLVCRRATVSVNGPWADETPQTRLVFISRGSKMNFPPLEYALNVMNTQGKTDREFDHAGACISELCVKERNTT